MKKREPVSHIMTQDVYTTGIHDSLASAFRLMKEKKIRHLPVVEGEQLIGILSMTDIMRLSFGTEEPDENTLSMFKIEQIMKPNPKTVAPTDEIRTVAEILTKEEFHALPVAEDGKLCGIVTTTDIIKYLLKQY
ncbi:CBS domain-containing protein [Thermonema rossianum]|uniref:CBS domain-containing protein n=1 Tax=Thermonema rossianum TaxID=55505 RepID=UPI000570F691|nr:CBS domain-containing protein [Thermonema rossianum]